MSAYGCIVPLSWPRLWNVVLPQWTRVLDRSRSFKSFCREFAPNALEWSDEFNSNVISAEYLSDVRWPPDEEIFAADLLRQSRSHQELAQLTEAGDMALAEAIKNEAAIELTGDDPFASGTDMISFYSRPQDGLDLQVAGFKNWPRILDYLFTIRYDRAGALYHLKPVAESSATKLLGLLLLSYRSFPAVSVLQEASTWPAFDDLRLVGYLTPLETVRLNAALKDLIPECTDSDPLFPLLADRVKRSAKDRLGLIAIHSGL